MNSKIYEVKDFIWSLGSLYHITDELFLKDQKILRSLIDQIKFIIIYLELLKLGCINERDQANPHGSL